MTKEIVQKHTNIQYALKKSSTQSQRFTETSIEIANILKNSFTPEKTPNLQNANSIQSTPEYTSLKKNLLMK